MKRKILVYSLLGVLALGGAIGAIGASNEAFAVRAEDAESKDLSDKGAWYYNQGDFVLIENWTTSGKGFSFEFQFADDVVRKMVFRLTNERGESVFNGQTYGFQDDGNGNFSTNAAVLADCSGHVVAVDAANKWYRYELMLSDVADKCASGFEDSEVGGINFLWNWGEPYQNKFIVRDMKVIDEYSDAVYLKEYDNSDGKDKYVNNFITVPDWKNSGKGFFLNFKPRENGQTVIALNGNSADGSVRGNDVTGMKYVYRSNGTTDIGKLFPLADGWYRLEVMFTDFPSKGADYESFTVTQFHIGWVGSGYGMEASGRYGVIDHYSYNWSITVDGEITRGVTQDKIAKPADPVKDGYHFAGWYSDATYETPFDFDVSLTGDTDVYAKFEAHSFVNHESNETEHWDECSCGEKSGVSAHVYDQEIANEDYLKVRATCQHGNIYYKTCVCGAVGTETFENGEKDLSAHLPADAAREGFTDPGCETEGGYDTVVRCQECGAVISSEHTSIPATGHNYVESSWELSEDKSSGTLTLVCSHDASHTVSVPATVSKQETEATTESEGLIVYTLTATYDGKTYSSTKRETTPKKEPEPAPAKSGCSGSVVATSVIVSVLALSAAGLVAIRSRKHD